MSEKIKKQECIISGHLMYVAAYAIGLIGVVFCLLELFY